MPVASLRWSLDLETVRETPEQQGVFTLWSGHECVYIGHTPRNLSLRDAMLEHLALRDAGIIQASHFTWEATSTPRTREGDLLELYLERNGQLPRYNGPQSPLRPPAACVTDLRAR